MWPVGTWVNSTLAKSGTLIDNIVKPVVAEGWQYLHDSTSFLMYLEKKKRQLLSWGFIHQEKYSISFDEVAVYPSVPHNAALSAFHSTKEKFSF